MNDKPSQRGRRESWANGTGLYGASIAGCQSCGACSDCAHIYSDAEGGIMKDDPLGTWVNLCQRCLLVAASFLEEGARMRVDELNADRSRLLRELAEERRVK